MHALELDGSNQKSLYRRAIALIMYVHDQVWTLGCPYSDAGLGDGLKSYVEEARTCLLTLQAQLEGTDPLSNEIEACLAQIDVLYNLSTYDCDIQVAKLVNDLKEDIDGCDDVDVWQCLEDLIAHVNDGGVSSSLTLLRASQGFRLLWYFMTDANASQVCRLIEAAHSSCVVWPKDAWGYLVDHACACKGNITFSYLCMNGLLQILRKNYWVKCHLFTRTWNDTNSIVQHIVITIGSCHLALNCIGKDAVATGCDIVSCYGNIISIGSNGISKGSKDFHTIMQLLNAFENAEDIVKHSRQLEHVKEDGSLIELEAKAKEELIKKRDAVYNPDAIMLKKRILECVKMLCCDKQFILGEFVEWRDGKKCASQLHHRLVSLGKNLVQNCPKRSKKILDMNLNPVSYEKKPYAADIIDNPTGDFLATIDLENPETLMKEPKHLRSMYDANPSDSRPIVEMFLDILSTLTGMESSLLASLLFKAGAFSICQSVTDFETISTICLAQKICANIVSLYQESKKALLQSSNAILLAGILKYATETKIHSFAIDELCCLVPTCQGNDFVQLISDEQGILQFLKEQVLSRTDLQEPALRLVEELAKRTIRCGSCRVLSSGHKIPKGYAWRHFDKELIENILYRKHCITVPASPHDDFDVKCFHKGFLSTKSLSQTPDHMESKTAVHQDSIQEQQVIKENVKREEPVAQSDVEQATDIHDEDDGIHVTEVYDSTPAEHVRASRVAWLAIGEKERTTWYQTSTDLSVSIKVPKGTATNEVLVEILSSCLTIRLKWYGKILHGEFFARVKANECTWCLVDDEIQLVLPKDSSEHWWKTLIKGWEEKGYYDLLKDAVDADEPHVSYDDMDESSKDLLDSMLERQAYINAGMLDLENGFDDFRIVLSDSSLQGRGA